MQLKRKFFVISALAAIVTIGVAATNPPDEPNLYKNLKVLPKNITHEELDKVMHVFNKGLGVKCNFCHAAAKDNERKLDFASDEKPEKEIARSMMKLTVKINKKYFGAKHAALTDSTLTITCITCHHGDPHPEGGKEKKF